MRDVSTEPDLSACHVGRVRTWLDDRGYGFLLPAGQRDGKGLFFAAKAAREYPGQRVTLRPGDRVRYLIGDDGCGRPCAAYVRRDNE